MASILILSKNASSIPLGVKLSDEGHICKIYIHEASERSLLKGFKNPSLVQDPTRLVDQYDLILCTSPGMGELCEEIKDKDKIVFGGMFNDNLYLNEEYRQSLIDILFKDICYQLGGEEISTTGWFNGEEFIFFYHTLEYNRLMEHNRGMIVQDPNYISFICKEDKLVKETVLPLKELLNKVKYLGPITVKCKLYPEGRNFISFTPWIDSTVYPFLELGKSPLWNLLWKCSQRKNGLTLNENDIAISISLSVPPYPYSSEFLYKTEEFFNPPGAANSHMYYFKETKGFIGYITARGDSINEARRRVYRTINNSIDQNPNIQFRSDIGYTYDEQVKKLKAWGWLE
jgi:hypothetical protein